jgi:hypothetical protein
MWYKDNFNIPKNGRKVDSIYGFSGALYLRSFFPNKDKLYDDFIKYALTDENIRKNDDISISGYLSMKNIERRIFSDFPIINLSKDVNANDISADVNFIKKLNLAITTAKSIGMYKNTEDVYFTETILFKILLVLFIILFIILFMCKNQFLEMYKIYETI